MEEISGKREQTLEILRGRSVLLVEDERINRKMTKALLTKLDCTVVIAKNGQEAVDIILSGDQTFDFVLMDLAMPVMNGIQATITLRENGITIPVIAHTSTFKPENQQALDDAGFNDVVLKAPVDIQLIAAAVERVLG